MRSKILFVSNTLALLYAIYLIVYFFGGMLSTDGMAAVAGGLATILVLPHMLLFLIGAIFGWIGFLAKQNWAALTAAILYSVGTLFFLAYFMFGVPILVLGFVGFANQKKLSLLNK